MSHASPPPPRPITAFTKRFDELEADLHARCVRGSKSLERLRQTTAERKTLHDETTCTEPCCAERRKGEADA
jgi:hypothetical protein